MRLVCRHCGYALFCLDEALDQSLSCPGCGEPVQAAAKTPVPEAPAPPGPDRSAPPTQPAAGQPEAPVDAPAVRPRAGTTIDLSEPKVFNHVLKAVLFGGVALWPLGIGGLLLLHDARAGAGALIALLVGWVFLTGLLRNLQALWARPHFRLTPQGLQLRYWRGVDFPSVGMFFPFYPIVQRNIAWSDYQGCQVTTHSTNGGLDWKSLTVRTTAGEHVIGWDVFAADVEELQQALLNYREEQVRQPLRQALNAAEFCRLRFRTALRVTARPSASRLAFLGGVAPFAGGAGILLLILFALLGSQALLALPLFLVPVLFVSGGALLAGGGKVPEGQGVLEISDEGVALGDGPAAMRLIPWEAIRFTRMARTTTNGDADVGLEIHLKGNQMITLTDVYTRSLEELDELIDPPLGKVTRVYERMELGEDVETASRTAGLPPLEQ